MMTTLTEDAPAQSIPPEVQPKPSFWTPEFEFNSIIEWHCGNCHKIVYYACWQATYCPHCGASIFNSPRRKMDGPQRRAWSYRDQGAISHDNNSNMKSAKPHRASTGAKRKI